MLKTAVLALAIGLGAVVAAQSQHDHKEHEAAPSAGQTAPRDSQKSMHDAMMAEMKAADDRLAALVDAMNAAKGDARVDALVRVVNELVGQHKAMHERMAGMPMMGSGMMRK